jgi:hypothetical protein
MDMETDNVSRFGRFVLLADNRQAHFEVHWARSITRLPRIVPSGRFVSFFGIRQFDSLS